MSAMRLPFHPESSSLDSGVRGLQPRHADIALCTWTYLDSDYSSIGATFNQSRAYTRARTYRAPTAATSLPNLNCHNPPYKGNRANLIDCNHDSRLFQSSHLPRLITFIHFIHHGQGKLALRYASLLHSSTCQADLSFVPWQDFYEIL